MGLADGLAVGLVLGSGLGAFAERLKNRLAIPYEEIPHFPVPSGVVGHAGELVLGDVDSTFETHAVWREPYREGVLFYLHEDVVRGVLTWNFAGRADWAREMIRERRPTTRDEREVMTLEVVGG